ncbi:MAG: hypothetical protein LBU40_05400 [Methanobrevibacter sp.]|jgi:hypothetical protein|nr:hypothetical protein [Methanobrevibacter sp.]
MGTGIVSVIPIILEDVEDKDEHFSKGFFENYNKVTGTVKMLVGKKNFSFKNQVFVNSSLEFNFKNSIN